MADDSASNGEKEFARAKANEIVQICYVVEDMDAAIERWMKAWNIGPFFLMRDVVPNNFHYYGKPGEIIVDIGLCQAGGVQLELIKVKSTGPNVYSDVAPIATQFYHHQMYLADNLDAEIARFAAMGIDVAQRADGGGVYFAYFDTRHLIGCVTEVIERNDAIEQT